MVISRVGLSSTKCSAALSSEQVVVGVVGGDHKGSSLDDPSFDVDLSVDTFDIFTSSVKPVQIDSSSDGGLLLSFVGCLSSSARATYVSPASTWSFMMILFPLAQLSMVGSIVIDSKELLSFLFFLPKLLKLGLFSFFLLGGGGGEWYKCIRLDTRWNLIIVAANEVLGRFCANRQCAILTFSTTPCFPINPSILVVKMLLLLFQLEWYIEFMCDNVVRSMDLTGMIWFVVRRIWYCET